MNPDELQQQVDSYYDQMWEERHQRIALEEEKADLLRKIEKLTRQRDALLDIIATR